uniref:COMM domain-containing protein 5 n=1 Tax=Glossina brevipalpis TaxID=37001 RepID=A0A1A9WY50_9MUSC
MSTNFCYTIVKNLRPYVKYFPQLTKQTMRILIQICVHYIETSKPVNLEREALNKLTHAGLVVPENFCELFAAISQIMQTYLRTPIGTVKLNELKECLKEDLKLNDECIEDLVKVLHNHRVSLTKNFIESRTVRNCTKHMQWRINISLSQELPRGQDPITPTIILHFYLPDGRCRTLELPMAMFHHLRYNLAILLSEMQSLEQRAVMKKF